MYQFPCTDYGKGIQDVLSKLKLGPFNQCQIKIGVRPEWLQIQIEDETFAFACSMMHKNVKYKFTCTSILIDKRIKEKVRDPETEEVKTIEKDMKSFLEELQVNLIEAEEEEPNKINYMVKVSGPNANGVCEVSFIQKKLKP